MMAIEEKEYHNAEECLLDLLKQNLPPEEVIRRFKEKGYSLDAESEEKEEVVEEEEEEEDGKEEEEGVMDLKIKKVTVLGDGMEESEHPIPRMGKLLRVARKAMKKERGE
tara:strand:- start:16 stop:345 length:330 start_codon:yes stop_codon:yes gene_type:complete